WVLAKQKYSFPIGYYKNKSKKAGADSPLADKYEEREEQSKEVVANADVVGTYRGKPVSEFRLHHSELLLQQIEKRGRTLGSCQHHTHLCMDFMRALGIAPLNFAADASRSDLLNHNWPARYDPAQHLWLACQRGRDGADWWFFSVRRPPVFSYATAAEHMPTGKQYQGPRPSPLFFSREIQGAQVKATSQTGIPTKEIREWMLTPCF
ncbi:MAG: hypothetical protein NTY53_20810, partial [Kiritimatiellaeota bacterium]|nr:hypothetical protein [Kiritimatiellota bacterium]